MSDQVVIQSLEEYRHRFIVKGQGIDFPCLGDAQDRVPQTVEGGQKIGNLLIISQDAFDALKKDPVFSSLCEPNEMRQARYVVLDKVPDAYVSADRLVADAKQALAEKDSEIRAKDSTLSAKDAEIAELRAKLAAYGASDDVSTPKSSPKKVK